MVNLNRLLLLRRPSISRGRQWSSFWLDGRAPSPAGYIHTSLRRPGCIDKFIPRASPAGNLTARNGWSSLVKADSEPPCESTVEADSEPPCESTVEAASEPPCDSTVEADYEPPESVVETYFKLPVVESTVYNIQAKYPGIKWDTNWWNGALHIKDQGRTNYCTHLCCSVVIGYQLRIETGIDVEFSAMSIVDGLPICEMTETCNVPKSMDYIATNGIFKLKEHPFRQEAGCPDRIQSLIEKGFIPSMVLASWSAQDKNSVEDLRAVLLERPIILAIKDNNTFQGFSGTRVFQEKFKVEKVYDFHERKSKTSKDKISHALIGLGMGVGVNDGKRYLALQNSHSSAYGDSGVVVVHEDVFKEWGLLDVYWFPNLLSCPRIPLVDLGKVAKSSEDMDEGDFEDVDKDDGVKNGGSKEKGMFAKSSEDMDEGDFEDVDKDDGVKNGGSKEKGMFAKSSEDMDEGDFAADVFEVKQGKVDKDEGVKDGGSKEGEYGDEIVEDDEGLKREGNKEEGFLLRWWRAWGY